MGTIRQCVTGNDVIKTRGGKVHPREVEAVLYALAGVKEATVIGVLDEVLDYSIKAIVVTAEGIELTEQDVLLHCARHLEKFKVPQSVEFRERLPQPTNRRIIKTRAGMARAA